MLSKNLAPVVHPYNWALVRVPVRKIEDHYIVYVADGYHRRYDESTLPDELKTKMAMILASPHHKVLPDIKLMKNRGKVIPIDELDFQHLENIVNYFSQEGTTVDPMRQGAFEKVMLRYLRLQAEINEVHKDIL